LRRFTTKSQQAAQAHHQSFDIKGFFCRSVQSIIGAMLSRQDLTSVEAT
jgi:hypothetical protein